MFGVNLKYVFPFVCAMIGSSIAGIICTATSTAANAIGVGGLPGILSINSKYFLSFALCMLVAVVVPFALTYLVGRRKGIDRGAGVEDVTLEGDEVTAVPAPSATESPLELAVDGTLRAVVSGTAMPLSEVDDQVFASGTMGRGVAIDPSDGQVVAPADAVVSVMMADTGHAVGLMLGNGMEVLIHIGIDTVEMAGDGFEVHVRQGDKVHAGDPLVTFDRDKVAAAGKRDTVMEVVTDPGQAENLALTESGPVTAGITPVVRF
jgi:PTS system trehalose-specific IIC component